MESYFQGIFVGFLAAALPLPAAAAAVIVGIGITVADTASNFLSFARKNPDLPPEVLEAYAGVLAMIAIANIIFAAAAIFGGPLAVVAYSVYMIFLSVMAPMIMSFYVTLFDPENRV